jgi:hypothetical protein
MTVFDRRRLLAAAAALAAPGIMGSRAAQAVEAADALVTDKLTIDMHSHGGGFMHENTIPDPVVDAMRAGGLAVACLAIVSDAPATKLLPDGRIHPIRDPDPGELYAWSRASFARVLRLAQDQGARLIGSTADLRAAPAAGPAVVVAAEGAITGRTSLATFRPRRRCMTASPISASRWFARATASASSSMSRTRPSMSSSAPPRRPAGR